MATEIIIDPQKQLFRLATVLYADNNYEVAPQTIYRKIIESVFLENGGKVFTIHQIIDFISQNYHLEFDEQTIKQIVTSQKETVFLVSSKNGEIFINLSDRRKESLSNKINSKTIDYYIREFQNIYPEQTISVNFKVLIYKFLYSFFSNNISSFQKLLDNTKDLSSLITLENNSYTIVEKEVINAFLKWDNPDKNKAIFDISSYALEYCMLTNNQDKLSIHLDNLKNKIFYLDTNIIYRALGINGDNRKNRTRTFLKKFLEASEKIVISKSTDFEFREGIKSHITRIRKYDSPKVNSQIFQGLEVQQDIYNFYHKWRNGKVNTNTGLFQAYILSVYDEFKKEFSISIDLKIPYDPQAEKIETKLASYTTSITEFKNSEGTNFVGSATIDAENVLWIELLRGERFQNIFDTKYFFISSDQGLYRWDYQRTSGTTVVILPSQWLTILLRYFNRTDDDFRSFINFLNLPNNEKLIDSEKLQIVLAGIGEITTNIKQQKSLIDNLIENKFNGVLDGRHSNEEVYNKAMNFAKSVLETQMDSLLAQNVKLTDAQQQLEKTLKNTVQKFENNSEAVKIENATVAQNVLLIQDQNNNLKLTLIDRESKESLRKWIEPAYPLLLLDIIILIHLLLIFLFPELEYNYVQNVIDNIIDTKNDIKIGTCVVVVGGLVTLFATILRYCWFRIGPSEKKKIKLQEFRNTSTDKYNNL